MAEERHIVGILYESDEWSDHKLASELRQALVDEGCRAETALINMCRPDFAAHALSCDLLISRVFASSRFRGHAAALINMEALVQRASIAGIPMLNKGSAHAFEIDKRASTAALAEAGLGVPDVLACADARDIDASALSYPCIIKPNCGGRTAQTAILKDAVQARSFLKEASGDVEESNSEARAASKDAVYAASPYVEFIVEEYIKPERGYLTRIEIVDGKVALIVKRSVAESGLSGYHEGSTYSPYEDPAPELIADALRAADALGFSFGSFDVIEARDRRFFIDANSVSNVSEDCTELLGCDLMAMHARAMARRYKEILECRESLG